MGATTFNGAVGFAIDVLSEIADRGIEARGRDLLQEYDGQRPTLPPSVLPDISPLVGGLENAPRPEARARQSGRTERGNVGRETRQPGRNPLGVYRLRDSRTAVALAFPFGNVHASVLAALSQEASNLGFDELRLAPGRILIALGQTSASVEALIVKAAALGFITDPGDPRLGISACAGKPACASGHIETRTIAASVAADQPDLIAQSGHIHISGCAKGCAHPGPAAITLVGDENGVGLVVNGTARQKPLAYTRPETLEASLKRLTRHLKETADAEAGGDLSGVAKDRLAAVFRQDV